MGREREIRREISRERERFAEWRGKRGKEKERGTKKVMWGRENVRESSDRNRKGEKWRVRYVVDEGRRDGEKEQR